MDLNFSDWMKYGIEKGWCGPPVCYTHDGLPMTITEFDSEDLDEHCIQILRMYEDDAMKKEVEENHSPSTWRNIYKEDSVLE